MLGELSICAAEFNTQQPRQKYPSTSSVGWAGLGWAGLGSGTEHVIHQQLGRQELMSEPFINARVDMFSNED